MNKITNSYFLWFLWRINALDHMFFFVIVYYFLWFLWRINAVLLRELFRLFYYFLWFLWRINARFFLHIHPANIKIFYGSYEGLTQHVQNVFFLVIHIFYGSYEGLTLASYGQAIQNGLLNFLWFLWRINAFMSPNLFRLPTFLFFMVLMKD